MSKQGKTILAVVLVVVALIVIAWSTGLFGGGGGGAQVIDPTQMRAPADGAAAPAVGGGARQAPGN